MRKAILLIGGMFLGSCSTTYEKMGTSTSYADKDKAECAYEADKALASVRTYGYQEWYLTRACMQARGYVGR